MRKHWFCCLVFLLLFLYLSPVYAQEHQPRTVRVGYFDYAGFLEQKPNGEYTGYGVEYLEEISAHVGWSYEYVYGTWEQCLKRLADGEIDLLCTAQYSEERAKVYDYAKYASGNEYAVLLVNKDNNEVFYNDYESFDGLRVGFMRDSHQNGLFETFARQHGFRYEAAVFDTAMEVKLALDSHQIDAMLTGGLQKVMDEKAVAKFSPEPFYFISRKGNDALMRELNDALEAIQTSNVDFNTELYNKYYGEASASQLAFTREEAAYIAAHPVLRVAYNDDWSPISYRDRSTERFSGICADVMRVLSERSGIAFEYVPASGEQKMVEMIASGEADLACALGDRYSQQLQQQNVSLTKSMMEAAVTLSKPNYVAFDEIHSIAVPKNCVSLERFAEECYPEAQIVAFDDTEACMQAVKNGQADAAFENVHVLEQYTKDHLYGEMEPVLSAQELFPLCLGLRGDEDFALRSLLNKLIDQLGSGELSRITIENTMEGPQLHLDHLFRRYLAPVAVGLLLLVLILVIFSSRRVERYAFVDPLTKRANETRFLLSAKKICGERKPGCYSVVTLDIDKFKFINTILGFEMGNRMLCKISDVLEQELYSDELFCRESSDLFILLMQNGEEDSLEDRLMRLMEHAAAVPSLLGTTFQYSMSCGVYHFSGQDGDFQEWIGWANLAREKAKEDPRNKVVFYDESMRSDVLREQIITSRMEAALKDGEFEVYYQPKICLETEKPVGAEALVRWKPKDGTMIRPDEFIPLFERNGFVVQLDLYVFERVCRQLREWQEQGLTPCPVSVNLSRIHLKEPLFFYEYFRVMKQYQIDPCLIELEITESTIFENKRQVSVLLSKLQEVGVAVSIDDFGSGYSSLNLMKDLPFDYLKLDKEFFNVASDTRRGLEVVRSVIEMANRLQMTVVAEGVETRDQVDFLKDNHCQIVQGYYYFRPLPTEEFEKLLSLPAEAGAET